MAEQGSTVGNALALVGPPARRVFASVFKAVALSILGTSLLGGLLVGLTLLLAGRHPGGHPAYAALVTVLACLLFGTLIIVKRAIFSGLRYGVDELDLGARTVGALFARLVAVRDAETEKQAAGERGNQLARTTERVPLARLEEQLKKAAELLRSERGGASGYLLGALHRLLVDRVEAITLSELRAEGEQGGGVDVVKARDKIADLVEEKLLGILDGVMLKYTALMALGMVAVSVVAGLLI